LGGLRIHYIYLKPRARAGLVGLKCHKVARAPFYFVG